MISWISYSIGFYTYNFIYVLIQIFYHFFVILCVIVLLSVWVILCELLLCECLFLLYMSFHLWIIVRVLCVSLYMSLSMFENFNSIYVSFIVFVLLLVYFWGILCESYLCECLYFRILTVLMSQLLCLCCYWYFSEIWIIFMWIF